MPNALKTKRLPLGARYDGGAMHTQRAVARAVCAVLDGG